MGRRSPGSIFIAESLAVGSYGGGESRFCGSGSWLVSLAPVDGHAHTWVVVTLLMNYQNNNPNA